MFRAAPFAFATGVLAQAVLMTGCGGPPTPPSAPIIPLDDVHLEPDRPPLALLPREGDPAAAFAIAVSTEGIVEQRAPEVTLALATLVEERLRPLWPALEIRPGFDGFEVRGVVSEASQANLDDWLVTIDRALRVAATTGEVEAARRKLSVLAKKPLPDPALRAMARCRGEAFSLSRTSDLSLAELESWRASALVLGRVALAVVGSGTITQRAARAMARTSAWPRAAVPAAATSTSDLERNGVTTFVEVPGLLPPRTARGTVMVRSPDPTRAVAAARALGAPNSPLLARLGGLDGAPRVDEITGTGSLAGGCIAVSVDFGVVEIAAPATTSRIATALALIGQEAVEELGPAPAVSPTLANAPSDGRAVTPAGNANLGRLLARQAADPSEAAERAAWWTLLATASQPGAPRLVAREETSPRAVVTFGPSKDKATPPDAGKVLEAASERSRAAFQRPVVTAKTRVERGQAELWMLFASPCGTAAEVAADAGLAAAFARASTEPVASSGSSNVVLEPWISADGIGVVAHAPVLPTESAAAHARRVADAAARAFAADPVDERAAARVRASLRAQVNDPRPRALFTLADAIAPGHPSWLVPEGNPDTMARLSMASLGARASALREGPLRVAVIANVDETQAAAAVRAADRWIARRPEGVRACPMPTTTTTPRPGTYAVEAAGLSEAYLAFPITSTDRDMAEWLSEVLDGEGGLLASSVSGAGLARTTSARVLGGAFAGALVIHVASSEGALDAAVLQVRSLVDRIRRGALTDADLAKAAARRKARETKATLNPRARLVALLNERTATPDPPPASRLATIAQTLLREESMIVVAMRPPRPRVP